jgi:hypothetical protein
LQENNNFAGEDVRIFAQTRDCAQRE